MAEYPYCWPWPVVRLQVLERDGYRCRIKGPNCTVVARHVDHIVPWLEGGAPYDPANLRAACEPCNLGRPLSVRAQGRRLDRVTSRSRPSRIW